MMPCLVYIKADLSNIWNIYVVCLMFLWWSFIKSEKITLTSPSELCLMGLESINFEQVKGKKMQAPLLGEINTH